MRSFKPMVLLAALGFASALATEKLADGLYAEFTTPRGVFVTELHYRQVPLTVASFVGLAEGTLAPRDGKPFFTGLTWYRVVPGFVIQSGNPGLKDTGDTPVPYTFNDEFVPGLHNREIGTLSMANAGPDTNGCEFFVTLGDCTRLNYLHTVFGRTIQGLEVLPLIQPNDAFTIKILRLGAEAKAFKADPETFKALAAKVAPYAGAAEPGLAAHFDDPSQLLPHPMESQPDVPPRAKNFNFKLANFERATGVRVVGRLFAKSPAAAEDAVPGAYMHALARKLGVDKHGALAAYFADEKDWRVWLSDAAADTFLGHHATAADLAPEGPLHVIKTAFIDAAVAEGDAAFARQQQAAPADQQPPPAQHLKLQTDAILDGLILKLEPK
ncbi:peptidylprolyl isomerase [Opitutus sp. GAS368]|uniref:peptidylprolyl isomerase n=1 Tax=Opitutus sp. GAS368 TaxID=1882749 RepID=UPI00087DA966|nr:peptidylprolyl isomerase [Opitutus sp. GAS368]SDS01245.1 Peptidyl-prolyl cis-trans isomerase (rotamase)-cyclophilin family [Opitutus sp. GAS368]